MKEKEDILNADWRMCNVNGVPMSSYKIDESLTKKDYLNAEGKYEGVYERIHRLSNNQHQLKTKLKEEYLKDSPNPDITKGIRGQMMNNRKGPQGLRALNKLLYATSGIPRIINGYRYMGYKSTGGTGRRTWQ